LLSGTYVEELNDFLFGGGGVRVERVPSTKYRAGVSNNLTKLEKYSYFLRHAELNKCI
jgi:hypothetical protein